PRKRLSLYAGTAFNIQHQGDTTQSPRTVSYDLELRIPVLHHDGYSIKKICEVLGTQKSLVYKTFQLHATLADVANPNPRTAGRRRSLNYEDINYIKSHCHLQGFVFLDELQSDLLSRRDVKVSLSTLSNSATTRYHMQESISPRPRAE
ncbi:hypothetical protein K503DRAFT_89741, partial [Rhizopogon vinicolor AM-OR11-026]